MARLEWIAFVLATFHVCVGVKFHDVNIPAMKLKGESAELRCDYDMEGDTLYSVKWYKNGREFFRYLPRDKPPLQFLNIPGITIDGGMSNKREVYLRALDLDSTGRYHCEVSAEGPSFKSAIFRGEMVIVDLPDELPRISGADANYKQGDDLHVNCTSYRSKPAASLQWYINNRKAGRDQLIEYVPLTEQDGLETSVLGLKFTIKKSHFISNELRLKCTSTIATVYWQTSEMAIYKSEPKPKRNQAITNLKAQTKHFSSREESSSGVWRPSPGWPFIVLWLTVLPQWDRM